MTERLLLAAALTIAAAACHSSSPVIDSRTLTDCEHGDVQIRVALEGARTGMERTEDRFTFNVEVSNNAHKDIVVKAIRVEALPRLRPHYQVDNAYRRFDQRIPENEDHEFQLPMTGRVLAGQPDYGTASDDSRSLELAVTAVLEGGDDYRCRFFVPAPVY